MSEKKHELIIAALGLTLVGIIIICAAFDMPGFSAEKTKDNNNVIVITKNQQENSENTTKSSDYYEEYSPEIEKQFDLININTASVEELTALNNIGLERANAIIEYREQYGNFDSIEELTNIYGIGENTLDELRNFVTAE